MSQVYFTRVKQKTQYRKTQIMINYEGTVELRIENGEWRIDGLRNKLPVTSDWSPVIFLQKRFCQRRNGEQCSPLQSEANEGRRGEQCSPLQLEADETDVANTVRRYKRKRTKADVANNVRRCKRKLPCFRTCTRRQVTPPPASPVPLPLSGEVSSLIRRAA